MQGPRRLWHWLGQEFEDVGPRWLLILVVILAILIGIVGPSEAWPYGWPDLLDLPEPCSFTTSCL